MEVFRYEATDITGRELRGNIQAASEELARRMLTDAGYRVRSLGTQAAPAPRPAPTTRPAAPRVQSMPQTATRVQPATRPAPATAPSTSNREPIKTAYSSEKQLHLLFVQMAELYRAGVSPGLMFKDLADKQRLSLGRTLLFGGVWAIPAQLSARAMREALLEIGKEVEKGVALSDALERYPYLFPEDVVSTVRAGEVGGFLPEALQDVGDQKEASRGVKVSLRWFVMMLSAIAILTPLIFITLKASGDSMMIQDKAGGNLPPVATFMAEMGKALKGFGWIPLVIAILIPGLQIILGSRALRLLRHQTALMVPFLSGRCRAEATHRFCWAMENLSRAGISPHTVFNLAAGTLPNLVLRQKMMDEASRMRENEPLSAAMMRTQMVPPEYVDVVSTGELVGDVPKALRDVGKASGRDLAEKNNQIGKRLWLIGLLFISILILPILAKGYFTHYDNIYKVFKQDE